MTADNLLFAFYYPTATVVIDDNVGFLKMATALSLNHLVNPAPPHLARWICYSL